MIAEQDLTVVILPPTPGACRICGDTHDKSEPHNRDSLIYQHKFRKRHGRYPTWEDAMTHCSPTVQKRTAEKLRRRGITVEVSHE